MKAQTLQVASLGGMFEGLPQPPQSATRIENMTVDPRTGALSSRVGYEKYRVGASSQFAPFTSLGRIASLFVLNQLPGGARQSILLESGGKLYLYHEVGQDHALVELATRVKPAATEASSVYTQYGDRVIITNGHDPPLMVRPWPLGASASITPNVVEQFVRPVGWASRPSAPDALRVQPLDAPLSSASSSANNYTGSATSNWYPAYPTALDNASIFGMGVSTEFSNEYRFAVAFISDTGSVGPRSLAVEVAWEIAAGEGGYRYCPTLRIPKGPRGTVARRIYATTNQGSTFYFVADVRNNIDELFHASRRSSTFSVAALELSDSVPMPAPHARVGAVFKSCLFLDGGRDESNRLFYSNPGLPDQFGVSSYITLTGEGGPITGLYSHYNNLIIFRENSIDVLTGAFPAFTVQTIAKQISCLSPHSVDAVPGVGVVFLSQEGIYALQGGLDGGSVFDIVPLGVPLRKQTHRLTRDCAARAVGRYSPAQREYHLYLPVDGDDRPALGCVYHLGKSGWSIRVGFPVGCIDRTHDGALVFGHHTGVQAGADSPTGLYIISATRALGGTITGDVYTVGTPPTSIFESAWHDFGDAQIKKQVLYVTIWAQTTGSVSLNLSFFKDFEHDPVGENKRFLYQPPDQGELPVYGKGRVGTAEWQDARLCPIRVPVALQSCSWFKFKVETTDDVLLVGYELVYASKGTTVIAGRTR